MDFNRKGFETKKLKIDNKELEVLVKFNTANKADTVKLLIPAKIPHPDALKLLQRCIATIKKFTSEPYEIWVVDNNSPLENIQWLLDQADINIVLNRTETEKGSYENALGLEIAAALINPDTKYIVTLHQDTVFTKEGWLTYMLSKFNDKVRAAGFREDKARVAEGILHVLGYVVDFQLMKKLKLDFFPDLPNFDVGDRVINDLRKQGYEYFATPNTIWDKSIEEKLQPVFKEYSFDRAVDDNNDVIFMHLGRGVVKSTGEHVDESKTIDAWCEFVDKKILETTVDRFDDTALRNKLVNDIWYSPRRYFVDKFFFENINIFATGSNIIDLGGKKENKRGEFNIEKYDLKVKYANLDESTNPDYLCDIVHVPVPDNTFDGAILGEVLEHVFNPVEILKEAYRMLKPGGHLLITTPFVYNLHADPYDYARYTDYWYEKALSEIGFKNITVENHGRFTATLANMLKTFETSLQGNDKIKLGFKKSALHKLNKWLVNKMFSLDENKNLLESPVFSGYTTGFGIVAKK